MALSIANRILLGFAAVTAVLLMLGTYTITQLDEFRGTINNIVERDMAAIQQLDDVENGQNAMRQARYRVVQQFLLQSTGRGQAGPIDRETIETWRRRSTETTTALTEARQVVTANRTQAISGERAQQWRRLEQALSEADAALQRILADTERQFEAVEAGNLDEVLTRDRTLQQNRSQLEQQLAIAEEVLSQTILVGQQSADALYEESRTSVLLALLLGVALSLLVAYVIRRSIVGPLGGFMGFVERIGRGDLSEQTNATGEDELGRLGKMLNAMVEGLRQLALQSRAATESLNAAVTEIRASTQEQAASVEEQLAAVQETAATVDEITHTGAQIAKRAQEVIAVAQATVQTSDAGLRAVDETTRAMDSIREQAEAVAANIVSLSEKTQAIGEIIATVNDISERSHLLALNAAIEAAAAGESGRSFAVVAAEMKTLADQAKEATSQVRSILSDIQRGINSSVMLTEEAVKRVNAGKDRTDTTQRTIEEMTGRIQESVQTFQQIVASTNQQQLGIEQVTVALQNIRQASQQTAASTRQLDEAAANLTSQAQQLLALADRYRL